MAGTLAEKAYEHIRERLANGELPPGTRLVNRTLASEIGVSVIPVREAINRLATEGLVEHLPGSGAFVRKSTLSDLDNLYVLRDALESCAAGEAARYVTEMQLEEMEAILLESEAIAAKLDSQERGWATKRQMEGWLDAERRFHQLVIEAARNPLLAKVTQEHRAIARIFAAQSDDPKLLNAEVARETCEGKRELIECLRTRDSVSARALVSAQIQRGRKQVLRYFRGRDE